MTNFQRLIIVDDDVLTLTYNKLLASQYLLDSHIICVQTSAELLSEIKKESSLKTLIILDMNLASENATDVLKSLNESDAYIKKNNRVVILTSAILESYKLKTKKFSEVIKHFEKPLIKAYFEELEKETIFK